MSEHLSLDKSQHHQMNMAGLQRFDPAVRDILASATHVAIYAFDEDTKTWQKRNVEGSLFVVKRDVKPDEPDTRIVIMNRLSPSNLVYDVRPSLAMHYRKPYLMIRDKLKPENGVFGIWFPDEMEGKMIYKTLAVITLPKGSTSDAVPAPAPAPAAAPQAGNGDIVQLLARARMTQSEPAAPAQGSDAARRPQLPAAEAGAGRSSSAGVIITPQLLASTSTDNTPPMLATLFAGAAPQSGPSSAQASQQAAPASAQHQASFAHALTQQLLPSAAPAPPAAAMSVPTAVSGGLGDVGIILGKQQLKAALLELVADDDFIGALHRKYVETLTSRLMR